MTKYTFNVKDFPEIKNATEIESEYKVEPNDILNKFHSGEIKISLGEDSINQLNNMPWVKQSDAEFKFIDEAINKQIPKKLGLSKYGELYCDVCGNTLKPYQKYCDECGQKQMQINYKKIENIIKYHLEKGCFDDD